MAPEQAQFVQDGRLCRRLIPASGIRIHVMQIQLLQGTRSPILECIGLIVDLNDALTIVAASYELNTNRVLLRDRQLPEEFFELQNRFAGEFIQKLVNYRIAVACVFDVGRSFSERFGEYIGEAKRGRQFRSFADESEAVDWLEEQ